MIQLDFDPARLRYEELLAIFWREHDFGRDLGSRQYRKAVLANETQLPAALASLEKLRAQGRTVCTAVERLGAFTRAEAYHQKHRLRARAAWLSAFRDAGYDDDALADSTLAARANGYLREPSDELAQMLVAGGSPASLLGNT